MELGLLRLEPFWDSVEIHQLVDTLVETVIWDPQGRKHLVRSALHRKFLRVNGVLPNAIAYSLMSFKVESIQGGITISKGEGSSVFPHVVATMDDLHTVTEVCSGIGVMSDGLLSCGATIGAKNELRETLIQFQHRQGVTGLVQGDIGDQQVLATFFQQHPHPAMIAAGFSCQPWSKLGDQQGFQDRRASSLHHTLRTAYFCRAHALMLECVTEAGSDKAVVDLIQAWCRCTGFHMHSRELQLEKFWPSKRNRWWCLILSPAVQPFEIRDLPCQIQKPIVSDLFPFFPAWPQDEEDQLSLDLYETNKFIEFRSFDKAIIKGDSALPTALHGWANQLQGCPCGCRASSMDHARLAKRGIFGALVVMEGQLESCQGQLTRTRHLHPWELCILTGSLPDKQWKPHLRLGICGLGQMASPIQSAWMYAQYHSEIGKQFGFPDPKSPEEILWGHVQKVFDAYHAKFPALFSEPTVEAFVSRTFDLLWAAHMESVVPSNIAYTAHEMSEHHALGKQLAEDVGQVDEITCDTECNIQGIADDGYADPEEAVGTTSSEVPKNWCGGSCPVTPEVVDPSLQTKVPTSRWECPFTDCIICDPSTVIEKPIFETAQGKDQENLMEPISPTIAFVVEEPNSIKNPFDPVGGVLAFSNKRQQVTFDHQQTKKPKTMDFIGNQVSEMHHQDDHTKPKVDEGFSQQVHQTIWDQERLVATGDDAKQIPHQEIKGNCGDSHHVQVFYPGEPSPTFIKVKKDVTIGCIEVAESGVGNLTQPVRTNNIVGVKLPIASQTTPFQQLLFHFAPEFKHGQVKSGPNWPIDTTRPHARVELLFRQEGWVAQDEMNFYLETLESAGLGIAFPIHIHEQELGSPNEWIQTMTFQSDEQKPTFSAMLVQHHWIPVVISKVPQGIRLSSTKQGLEIIQNHIDPIFEFVELCTPEKFHADCGFQTVGAIIRATCDLASTLTDAQKVFPIDAATAVTWRRMFEQHLFLCNRAKTPWFTYQLVMGGASGETPEAKIKELLIEHGVPSEVVDERAAQAFSCLGRPKIIQAIRSHRPWQELKSISNAVVPRFQLVLPSELQNAIQARAARPSQFGAKNHKQLSREQKAPIVIRPEDLSVPDGIFKQGQSELVRQIPVQAIGPEACGVVVISAGDALPYIRLSRPISKNGLGLLILDHSHEGCQGIGNVIRFPCRCEKNGEPIIVTARLIQLGCTEISRHFPEQIPSVEEIPTTVVRAVLYRDEVAENWNDITDRPVKHVIQLLDLPVEEAQTTIMDVWDRQYLTQKMGKSKPKESDIFIVSLRLSSKAFDVVMQKSGSRGLYIEPRTPDGRQPSDEFRVVWLAKTDKGTALTALQTTTGSVSLARSGLRFGIRAKVSEIEAIHNQHKSHLPYLDTNAALKYMVGPFPYGATREGIIKVFSGWGWSARPTQPRGRSGDGQGVQWEVMASSHPDCEVYSMKHGDVILTLMDSKKASDKPMHDIMASAKTIALLRQPPVKPMSLSASEIDPLQHHDPWASYQPPKAAKFGGTSEAAKNTQIEAITANVDRRLAETLAQVDQRLAANDTVMQEPDECKIAEFEERLQRMEVNLQQQQQSQQHYQQQVSVQFQQVQSQIESQSSNFQTHLDQKMNEQLAQIELLLDKKQRRE